MCHSCLKISYLLFILKYILNGNQNTVDHYFVKMSGHEQIIHLSIYICMRVCMHNL